LCTIRCERFARTIPSERSCLPAARNNVAVAAAHTNWDVAEGGINDVLANLLRLESVRPLQVTHREPLVNVTLSYRPTDRDRVFDAMAGPARGPSATTTGAAFSRPARETFRPLPGANPQSAEVGRPAFVARSGWR
jgi:putative NIF3 family GTP cyclohydrolase 1 type 2